MKNRTYFFVLLSLLILYCALVQRDYFRNVKFIVFGAAAIIIFIICKDAFTGRGWFEPQMVMKSGEVQPVYVTDTVKPASPQQIQGYLQLMHEVTNPSYHDILTPAINNLKTIDNNAEDAIPLYRLANFADEHKIPFIIGLDWKSEIENLEWRITSALRLNYNTIIELPPRGLWGTDTSISYDGVLETYNKVLKDHGFQMGFIDTESDEYMLLIFKTSQKSKVEQAVKLIGYKYYER